MQYVYEENGLLLYVTVEFLKALLIQKIENHIIVDSHDLVGS